MIEPKLFHSPTRSTRHPSTTDLSVSQLIFPYGVGIDTHSGFIQVCAIWTQPGKGGSQEVHRAEKEFSTDWPQLVAAKEWTLRTLQAVRALRGKVAPDTLRYCIESTGTYHMPVLLAWRGIPCVVNPLLAGPTRRKTDVLDARLLAHQSITGLWKPSFIPSADAQQLRVVWAARADALSRATRCSNQINNIILRFGHTLGRDCSMRSAQAEGVLSDMLDGRVPAVPGVSPLGLPPPVRPRITALMADMRASLNRVKLATIAATNFISARDWPIGTGTVPGSNLLALLQSVPGVGVNTSITWLVEVCDPRRFQADKQVAAFSGCDPSLKVSAGKVTSQVRRQGNLRLHQALLYAASGLLRRPAEPLGAWGKSIAGRHKKGGHRKACGAVARRLAASLWHVHRKGEMFTYDGYNLSSEILLPNVPLSSFLTRRAVATLATEGIRTTKDLAAAYSGGKLASIYGLGQQSIASIKSWVQYNGRGRSFAHRRDALTVGERRAKRDKSATFTPPDSAAAAAPPQPPGLAAPPASRSPAKDYCLDPSLKFTPRTAQAALAHKPPTHSAN